MIVAVVAIFALVALVFIVVLLTGDDATTDDAPTPVETTSTKVIDESFLLG